jgi:hypothetical protein
MFVAVPPECGWFRSLLAFACFGNVTRGHNPPVIYQWRKSHGWLSQAIGLLTLIKPKSRVIKGL